MNLYPGLKEGGRTMFLRQHCGEANSEDGRGYELSFNLGSGTPIVISKTTGRTMTLSWQDLIDLAIEAGIDKKEPLPAQGVEFDITLRSPTGRPIDLPVERRGENEARGG